MGFPRWEGATHCTGGTAPGTAAFMRWFVQDYHGRGGYNLGTYNCRNGRGSKTLSLHGEGRAADCGFPVGDPDGDAFVKRLLPHVGALGVQELIYERRIWSAKSPQGRPYTGVAPHLEHVHVGFTREAGQRLTYATIVSILAPDKPHWPGSRTLDLGMRGADVAYVQRFLNGRTKHPLSVDGIYGPGTKARVLMWERSAFGQGHREIVVDGVLGPRAWALMKAAA